MMTSVRLKPETKERLKRVAKMSGKTVSRVIQEVLDKHCDDALKGQTLDIALAPWIGCLHSEEPTDARDVKKVFGEGLDEKKRIGRL